MQNSFAENKNDCQLQALLHIKATLQGCYRYCNVYKMTSYLSHVINATRAGNILSLLSVDATGQWARNIAPTLTTTFYGTQSKLWVNQ